MQELCSRGIAFRECLSSRRRRCGRYRKDGRESSETGWPMVTLNILLHLTEDERHLMWKLSARKGGVKGRFRNGMPNCLREQADTRSAMSSGRSRVASAAQARRLDRDERPRELLRRIVADKLVTLQSTDPARCAEAIVDRVGREIVLAVPIGIGKPNRWSTRSTGSPRPTGAFAQNLHGHVAGAAALSHQPRAALRRAPARSGCSRAIRNCYTCRRCASAGCRPTLKCSEFFLQAGAWLANPNVQQHYTSLNYSHVAGHLSGLGPTRSAQLVAPQPGGEASRSVSAPTPT